MTRPIQNDRVECAENFLRIQRKRSLFFSDNPVFDDPAWELLLEIYIATERDKCISVGELKDRLSAPSSIISRWISVFEDRHYLVRCKNHDLNCVQLTDRARDRCYAYLDAISEA